MKRKEVVKFKKIIIGTVLIFVLIFAGYEKTEVTAVAEEDYYLNVKAENEMKSEYFGDFEKGQEFKVTRVKIHGVLIARKITEVEGGEK